MQSQIASSLSWIASRKEQQAQRTLEASLRAAQEREVADLLEKHSAGFWKDFLACLQVGLNQLVELDIQGTLTAVSTLSNGPHIHRVFIRQTKPLFRQTYTSIEFAFPLQTAAYLRTLEGFAETLLLAALPTRDGVGAILPDQIMPLTAQQAADYVLRTMVDRIDPLP